jgi:3-hydroxyisobutyrate dehydrogenase-like beta-hydroxyacid dehydrogenase
MIVRGYDPDPTRHVSGLQRFQSIEEAVESADVILSLNWARVALKVASLASPHIKVGAIYADLNTAAPSLKNAIADRLAPHLFTDVALLNPVPGNGIRTPALSSGLAATTFCQIMQPLGMPIEPCGKNPGDAAAKKLVRSVFYKGLAACVGEALEAARALGCEDWLSDNIGQTLTAMNQSTVERLVQGSQQHAVRREQEMQAATQMLIELGVEPRMASSSAEWLKSQIDLS